MGQKVNPIALSYGEYMVGWKSRWYASKQEFAGLLLLEISKFANFIKNHPQKTSQYRNAGIDRIEIERTRDEVKIVLHVLRDRD
jgi:small subunit ribosomal protein S3